jgi:hypothetical protein
VSEQSTCQLTAMQKDVSSNDASNGLEQPVRSTRNCKTQRKFLNSPELPLYALAGIVTLGFAEKLALLELDLTILFACIVRACRRQT